MNNMEDVERLQNQHNERREVVSSNEAWVRIFEAIASQNDIRSTESLGSVLSATSRAYRKMLEEVSDE